jgi:hypothetical protein
MGAMMERLGVDAALSARNERAFAAAGRRCLWCAESARCELWLSQDEGPSATAPSFCPNAAFLAACRREGGA